MSTPPLAQSVSSTIGASKRQSLLNKVPEVTLWFWIIKVLCTTVGESAADYLNYNCGWGLTNTSILTGALFIVVLAWQWSRTRYIAGIYWLTVVLVSVFGTLVTDNLTDGHHVPLETSTIVFSGLLGLVFLAWWLSERTLSIHSIYTKRREGFYWLAILITFALGTATGDLVSEGLGVGYAKTGLLCLAIVALVTIAWRAGLDPVLSFWIAYILTRPLGASLGDFLAQPKTSGGLGLGVATTSAIFLTAILATITYLSVRKPDITPISGTLERQDSAQQFGPVQVETGPNRTAMIQTVCVILVFVIAGTGFYRYRTSELNRQAAASGSVGTKSPLGDLSAFSKITQDTLDLVVAGQQSRATTRVTDLETLWDQSEAVLKRRNPAEWTKLDATIDKVLRALRSTSPDSRTEEKDLRTLLGQLGD